MREEASYRACRAHTPVSIGGRARFWVGVIAIVLRPGFALPADESLPAEPPPERISSPVDLNELPLLWQAQRSEIATAEIRFRCFNSSFESPQNTPEHISALLARHDLVAQPDELEAFLEVLTGRTFEGRKPWDDMILAVSGGRRRVDGRFCQFATDGDLEAVFTPVNHQLDLQPVGKSTIHHYDLPDLRWIPPEGVSAAEWQFLRADDGDAVFNVPPLPDGPAFEVLTSLDAASGIVTHSLTRHPDGSPAMEFYQSGLDLHASGVLFPRLRVDVTYANGSAYTVRVMLVHQATFNEPISDAAFVMTAAAGTRVVDYRVPEKDIWIASEEIADALAVPVRVTTPAGPAAAGIVRPARTDKWWWLFSGIHLAGATAAVALLWHRRRSMFSRSSSSPD